VCGCGVVAQVDALLDVHHTMVRRGAAPVSFSVMGKLGNLPVNEAAVSTAEPTLRRAMKLLERVLASAEVAAADVAAGTVAGGRQDLSSALHAQCKGFESGAFLAAGFANLVLPTPLDGTPGGPPPIAVAPWLIPLCGGPSLADISVACELEQLLVMPDVEARFAPYPHVVRWLARVRRGFNQWALSPGAAPEALWDKVHKVHYKVVCKAHQTASVAPLLDRLLHNARAT
jgi:hypothetical protein